jgi:hypothetical protein
VFEDTASAMFGMEGLRVTGVQAGPGGALEVWAVTDYPVAAACPDCGTVACRVHEMVLARPRDVRRDGDRVDVRWVEVRRKCGNPDCPRKTFTEWAPGLPPLCRVTARLREQAGAEVAERGITPAEADRHAGVSWPVVHDAFAAAADPVLDQPAAPAALWVPIIHPCWSGSMPVLVEGAAEPVPSADIQLRDLLRIGNRLG